MSFTTSRVVLTQTVEASRVTTNCTSMRIVQFCTLQACSFITLVLQKSRHDRYVKLAHVLLFLSAFCCIFWTQHSVINFKYSCQGYQPVFEASLTLVETKTLKFTRVDFFLYMVSNSTGLSSIEGQTAILRHEAVVGCFMGKCGNSVKTKIFILCILAPGKIKWSLNYVITRF